MYKFATLDPRPIPAAAEANNVIFALGPVLGVEVTVPALAARCTLGNIDPQHSGGDASLAAIEVAWNSGQFRNWPAGPGAGEMKVTLATVRADLDSIGFMAIMAMRYDEFLSWCSNGQEGCEGVESYASSWRDDGHMANRVRLVAEADKFARGGWPGPRPLPTKEDPWVGERPLAVIAAAIADFKVPMAERVATMERWLLTGDEPEQYRTRVEAERSEMIAALESGAIVARTVANGRIAVVESTHRAATSVGYSLAPVVVALNPSFKQGPSEPYKKFTVCAFELNKFADIKSALAELATLETGWGGSPTIGGSPQGVNSTLTVDQVVAVVEKHLR